MSNQKNLKTQLVSMKKEFVKIGCWSGFWGDSTLSLKQLLTVPDVQYLVGDFLAEMTMSILVMQKQRSHGKLGYASDFVNVCINSVSPFETIDPSGTFITRNRSQESENHIKRWWSQC